jgi:RNA polymerase sigma-70 factor (ECF subfamily)
VGLLSTELAAELDAVASPQALALPDLEERVEELLHTSRATWPDVKVDPAAFARHLGRHLAHERDFAGALAATRGPDLYLAYACAAGDTKAIRALEKDFLRGVPSAVRRLRLPKSSIDEVTQLVRHKLLLGDGGSPKIADYAGRGPLESWVRVVAVRTALSLLRKRDGDHEPGAGADAALLNIASPGNDPELGLVHARYAGEFRTALESAFRTLSAQDRTILRLHFVDGLNIDQIGAIYRVHRATVARWIARSRQKLLEETKTALKAVLRLSSVEFESLMGVVRSQLHLSLSGLLNSRDGEGEV